MRRSLGRITAAAVCLLLVMPLVAAYAQQDDKDLPDSTARLWRDGTAYCFRPRLVFGNIVIVGGRCYNFYLIRTSAGAFLGFGPQGQPLIPPGQIVRLNTPAGLKLKGRLFYLVPIVGYVAPIPVDAIQFLTVQASVQGNRIAIAVPRSGDTPRQVLFEQR